jgi:hypothetical protein
MTGNAKGMLLRETWTSTYAVKVTQRTIIVISVRASGRRRVFIAIATSTLHHLCLRLFLPHQHYNVHQTPPLPRLTRYRFGSLWTTGTPDFPTSRRHASPLPRITRHCFLLRNRYNPQHPSLRESSSVSRLGLLFTTCKGAASPRFHWFPPLGHFDGPEDVERKAERWEGNGGRGGLVVVDPKVCPLLHSQINQRTDMLSMIDRHSVRNGSTSIISRGHL